MSPVKRITIIGCGDIGKKVASIYLSRNIAVSALLRSEEKAEELKALGISATTANLDIPESLENFDTKCSALLYFAPPPGGGNSDPRVVNFLSAIKTTGMPEKIIYLSTSGVYGDCGGMKVTEENIPNPMTARGKRRLDAEKSFTAWGNVHGIPVVILRVTGIYGPGRLPLQHIQNRTPILNDSEAPVTNRIHADDLAEICVAAAEMGEDGDIFNISDGEHGTMTQYFDAISDLMNLPRLDRVSREEASQIMPPLLYSYFSESRTIDNSKMLNKLKITLRYPTLAEGLPTCIKNYVAK